MGSATSTKKMGERTTKQRTAVMEVLEATNEFTSAKDLYHELRERGEKIGLTTVYRTLQSLADIDAVDALHPPSGETLYRQCNSDHHHHHLVCTKCGRTEEIDGGPIESWAKEKAAGHGFALTGHEAEIFGICAACQSATSS